MLNHIVIMGRLTRDPEMRSTTSGTTVTSFTVACERDFGEKVTDFIDCVAWRQTGEFVSKYFRKGSMIAVAGRLQSRKWQDRDGNNRTSWEVNADNVYFAESKREERPETAYGKRYGNPNVTVDKEPFTELPGYGEDNPFVGNGKQLGMDDEDDLPF